MIFGYMYKIETIRTSEINNNTNNEVITLPNLPHEEFIWHANPASDLFEYRFKLFYGIDETKDIKFVPYKVFKNN